MKAGRGNLWFPGRIAPLDEHDNHMEIKIIMLLWDFLSAFATQSQVTSFQCFIVTGPANEK